MILIREYYCFKEVFKSGRLGKEIAIAATPQRSIEKFDTMKNHPRYTGQNFKQVKIRIEIEEL